MDILRKKIAAALKANLKAGMVLQLLAVSIWIAYNYWPATQQTFNFFAELKSRYGWQYSMIATSFFGGLIPFLYLYATKKISSQLLPQLLFYVLFWAYRGLETDLFYQLQTLMFGDSTTTSVVVQKVAFDQLVYAAFWAAPSIGLAYLWKEVGFSFSSLKERMTKGFFFEDIPTVIVTNWLIWTPAVAVIYSMPTDLQVPLFNLVLCFFVLLIAHISGQEPQQ